MIGRAGIRRPSTRPAEEAEPELDALKLESEKTLRQTRNVLEEFRTIETSLRRR